MIRTRGVRIGGSAFGNQCGAGRAKWSSEEDHFVVQIGERVPLTIYRNSTGRCVPAVKSYCWLQSLAGESVVSILFTLASDRGQRPLNS
jgi:hypothetical protein